MLSGKICMISFWRKWTRARFLVLFYYFIMLRLFLSCSRFLFSVSAILCTSFGDYFPSLETYQEHIRKMGTDYDHNMKIQGCIDPFFSFIRSWKSQKTEHQGSIHPSSCISPSLVFISSVYSTAFALNSHNKDEFRLFLFFPRSLLPLWFLRWCAVRVLNMCKSTTRMCGWRTKY